MDWDTIIICTVVLGPLVLGLCLELLALSSSPTIVQPGDERPEPRQTNPGGEGLGPKPTSLAHPRPPHSRTFLSEKSGTAE